MTSNSTVTDGHAFLDDVREELASYRNFLDRVMLSDEPIPPSDMGALLGLAEGLADRLADALFVTPFDRGRAAGYAEAVDRESTGDAASAADASTWFAVPAGAASDDAAAAEYKSGFVAGWAAHFDN